MSAESDLWRGRIVEAIAENRLLFWGQPVAEARTETVHHYELLIRMELAGETITPNLFLPHAESCELVTEIDRWAIVHGAQFARDVPVAVNLSARSLSSPDLVAMVRNALAESNAPPENLLFEITESAAVEDLVAARALVDQLNGIGCGVALDHFGRSSGSFTYLDGLAVSELKIDFALVRDLADDETGHRVVRSIIALANDFDIQTVAEGVEDQATLELLQELGVDRVQGYHIGYPRRMTVPPGLSADAPAISSPTHVFTAADG